MSSFFISCGDHCNAFASACGADYDWESCPSVLYGHDFASYLGVNGAWTGAINGPRYDSLPIWIFSGASEKIYWNAASGAWVMSLTTGGAPINGLYGEVLMFQGNGYLENSGCPQGSWQLAITYEEFNVTNPQLTAYP